MEGFRGGQLDQHLTERQQHPPARPERGPPGVLLDLWEKTQHSPKSLQSVLGAAPCTPSSLRLILLSLIRLSLFCGVGSCVPFPAPAFIFLVSSALLASFVPWCLWGRELSEDFQYHFVQGVVLRGCWAPPVLTGEGSEVFLGGRQPVCSWGPSHSGSISHPAQSLGLEAVSHCGSLTELG